MKNANNSAAHSTPNTNRLYVCLSPEIPIIGQDGNVYSEQQRAEQTAKHARILLKHASRHLQNNAPIDVNAVAFLATHGTWK